MLRAARLLPLVILLACAAVTPRFPQPIAADFAHHPMRVLETDSLQLYYPAAREAEAKRVAARLGGCVKALRKLPLSTTARPRLVVFLTDANFNNAYVQPAAAGFPQQMVLAQHMTIELFNFLGLGAAEIGDVACHEATHYVQMQQTDGLWRVLNLIFGDLNQPNVFTESWFLEGLATHYEGRLGEQVGRPNSPVWNALFDSGVAARHGRLTPADLSPADRDEAPFGGNYLVGEHFVEFLAQRYGEKKLWELVDAQGSSVFSPFGVTLRFKSVYGKSIGALLDEFSDSLAAHLPDARVPADQQVLARALGPFPRLATGPDGAIATLTDNRDELSRLVVREADGRVRFSRRLTPILPGRRWIIGDPGLASGMSFTADGRWLFLVMDDVSSLGDELARIWKIDARSGEVVDLFGPIQGFGGSVRPDGRAYLYVRVAGDTANLVERELATGAERAITHFEGKSSLGAPAYSPDGARVAFSRWTGQGFDLFVRDADGSLAQLTRDGRFNYGARWIDDDHLLFMHDVDGRAEGAELELRGGGGPQIVTGAPFLAFDPAPLPGGRVAFLDREGWTFNLATAPLKAIPVAPKIAAAALTDPPPVSETLPPGTTEHDYSAFDHLLRPNFRVPFALLTPRNDGGYDFFGSLSVQGQDRLGLHSYAGNVYWATGDHGPSFDLTYGNAQLAPWYLALSGGRTDDGTVEDRFLRLSASRSFWTSPVDFSVLGVRRNDRGYKVPVRSQLVGPSLSTRWVAADGTAYGGTRLALAFAASASTFPKAFGSDFNLSDFRAQVAGVVPLPFSSRHALSLSLVGRTLPGAPGGLLRVGGVNSALLGVLNHPELTEIYSGKRLPIDFIEPLRGYEDVTLRANRVAIASATYRLHIPLDRGTASILYLLPSFFANELQFDAFGEIARTIGPDTSYHRVVGASIRLNSTIGSALPLSLFAQIAYRFDDGLPPLFFAGVGL